MQLKHAVAVMVVALGFAGGTVLSGQQDDATSPVLARAKAATKNSRDYAKVLLHTRRARRHAEHLVKAAPLSWIRRGELASRYLDEAHLTGEYKWYEKAERALAESFEMTGGRGGPFIVRAQLNFTLHRFAQVEPDLARLEATARRNNDPASMAEIVSLRASLALQGGDYEEASSLFLEATDLARSYSVLTRFADYQNKTGHFAEAQALYDEAERLLPKKEVESRAWIGLQRGLMHLHRGQHAAALAEYRKAAQIFPGWWLIEEHIAEIDALQARPERAIASYRELIERTGSPEFMDALAQLLIEEQPGESAAWQAKSRAIYEKRLAQFPEATYGHALAHFLEADGDEERALSLAQKNYALRPGGEAATALAQAYIKVGKASEARSLLEAVVASPYQSAETHATLAIACAKTGDPARAKAQRQAAQQLDPGAVEGLSWLSPDGRAR